MNIRYLGHSCFLIKEGNLRVLTDPYGDIGFQIPNVSCDFVTVSHTHYDHCNLSAVKGHPVAVSREGNYSFGEVSIEGIPSFHDNAHGSLRGKNIIFVIRMGGRTVCHLGDLGQSFDPSLAARLAGTDVLMIPVGGNYTIDGAEAAKYVEAIDPAVVIPMHYFVKGLTIDISDAEAFLSRMRRPVEFVGSEYELSTDTKKIIVMERIK